MNPQQTTLFIAVTAGDSKFNYTGDLDMIFYLTIWALATISFMLIFDALRRR